jgi:hypothetical protein
MINVQYSLIVEHWTFCILHSMSSIISRGPDTAGDNSQELFAFLGDDLQRFVGTSAHLPDELEPRPGFPKLLQANPELVNEITPGFGSLNFPVVRRWRRSAANELVCDMLAYGCGWQLFTSTTHGGAKRDEPVFQIVPSVRHPPMWVYRRG